MRLALALATNTLPGISSGGGGGEPVELLDSFDISDPENIASFTRAAAAGFTGNGETAFQREAAEDELRDAHYVDGVACVLLEEDPTQCALVAPGTPSVTPGELEFDATFSAIPVTDSLLRYEYRLDGSGGWTSNGTSSTISNAVATAGDHTLDVRAVSTGGVAGATATSASFTVTAPAASYLLSDDFDYADAAAAAAGGWVDAGTPVWGSNKLTLNSSTDASVHSFTASGEVWVYTELTQSALNSAQCLYLLDGSNNVLAEYRIRNTGAIRITHGTQLATSAGTPALSATNQGIWWRYKKGTGSNGEADAYLGTPTTRGSLVVGLTNGDATADAAKLSIGSHGWPMTMEFARVRVDNAEIGDSPT